MLDSLPEPSELVEDEWAAMKIRFSREGLLWDKLGQDQRTLQVHFGEKVRCGGGRIMKSQCCLRLCFVANWI